MLLKYFVQELLFTCTDGRYIPENYDRLSDLERIHRTKKITSQFYSFFTFETFARDLSKISDTEIRKRYSNTIIVIDEVHNLRSKEGVGKTDLDIYKSFFRFLHTVQNCKIMLMSGTVMKDGPKEIAHVMNLILPPDLQFTSDFMETYFNDDNTFKPSMIQDFSNRVRGRISYLKAMSTDVKKEFMGERVGELKHFKVWTDFMSPFQTGVYLDAYARDKLEKNIYSHSRQATLFVFPDKTYGMDGFSQARYITRRRVTMAAKKVRNTYALGSDLAREIGGSLENLKKFSSKYAETIRILLDHKTNAFVYCEFVNGSGLILFAKLLEHFGFARASGGETTKRLRYAIITNQTTSGKEMRRLINRFNSPDNVDGEFISVILGSKIISEGITLKNIRREFILSPHWNYSETAQSIARGWRLRSHQDLVNRGDSVEVKIYQQVSMPSVKGRQSIDLEMYETSEVKDVSMKQIEHIIKQTAFDCPLTIERNQISGADGSRDCDYTSCDYKCSGSIQPLEDMSTYNIYYSCSEAMVRELKIYFRTHFSLTMGALRKMFPDFDIFEVIQAIKNLINTDTVFKDQYGLPNYLRIQQNTLYISPNPSKAEDNIFSEYYSKTLIVNETISFKKLIDELYVQDLPRKIHDIFEHPQYIRSMVTALPDDIQLVLLQGAILAHARNLEKNRAIREDILTYFDAHYSFSDGKWVEWFEKDVYGINCLDVDTGVWSTCKTKTKIEETAQKKQLVLKQSPIGFYGLYNPKLNDFCVRDVRNVTAETDLRKLTVGRRCVDWELSTLVDIVARRMKIPPPSAYLLNAPRKDLLAVAKRSKYVTSDDLSGSDEDLRRVIFWSGQYRASICAHMKDWFTANGLIEDNTDCGHQKKRRGRVV